MPTLSRERRIQSVIRGRLFQPHLACVKFHQEIPNGNKVMFPQL